MGLIAPAAFTLPMRAFAGKPDIDVLVVDRRYLRFGQVNPSSVPIHVIDGDVTALWYDWLDPMWRKTGFVVAGYTGRDVLFVLEHLAWDRGHRVVRRHQMDSMAQGDLPLINWVIAPVHPSVIV
jgi:hypothetical protein